MWGFFLYSGDMKKIVPYFYYAVFLVPLLINPWGFQMYGGVKTAWFLLFLGLFFAWSAWQIFRDTKFKLKYHKGLIFYLGLWFLSLILSSLFSAAPVRSIFGDYLYLEGALFFSFLFLHFFVCLQLFSKKGAIENFFNLLKIIALMISVHSIGQYFNIDPFTDVDNSEYLFRVYGTVGQPNFLAQWLIFPLIVTSFDFWQALGQEKKKSLILNGMLLLLMMVTIYLTKNRATWLALFLGFYLWLFVFSDLRLRLKLWLGGLAIAAVVFVVFLIGTDFRSLNSRSFLWQGAGMSLDFTNIWLGHGMASFKDVFLRVMPKEVFFFENFYTLPGSPHSEFLQVLLERGLFGLSLYLFSIFYLFKLIWQKKLKNNFAIIAAISLFVYLISVQFSFSTVEHLVVLAAFWAILLLKQLKFKTRNIQLLYQIDRILLTTLFSFLALISFFFAFSIVKADVFLLRAVDRFIYSDPRAYDLFDQANQAMPFWIYTRQLAMDLSHDFATDDFLRPNLAKIEIIGGGNFAYHILAIKLAAKDGDLESVDRHYLAARTLGPNAPILYTEVADAYAEAGECEKALEVYRILEDLAAPYYLWLESDQDEDLERARLFRKHAYQFVEAMENKARCEVEAG